MKVAVSSPDHTTLVAAIKAANLVDAMANVAPLHRVLRTHQRRLHALPAGTAEGLLSLEKKWIDQTCQ